MAYPSVYPTGTTIYYPEECFNGYTVFPVKDEGAVLVDMNGNVVNLWKGLIGFPAKILPGGYVMGSTGGRDSRYGFQDNIDLVQIDWHGNVVWRFEKYERIKDPGEKARWMARQHHDYQREGNPVGYYVPGMDPMVGGGNTLILCHKNLVNPRITDKLLLDDTIIEVTWDGEIVWEWICSEHFDEMGFSEDAKNTMYRHPTIIEIGEGVGDWMHTNSISSLGPNKWYDAGDERFHPDNIIWDGRQTNIIAITGKKTGKIVWQIGPDYHSSPELRELGWIIGQHHAHMIPRGLPGEGNILVFDNGGWAGYGPSNPGAPTGHNNALRDHSRVLEFDPVTLEVAWQYSALEAGFAPIVEAYKFYSGFVSSAQRLPNGNTLITEGTDGRLFEVTPEHRIVWEYISPHFGEEQNHNLVYRAYRVPYEWIPQVEEPDAIPVPRLDNSTFRVTGFLGEGKGAITTIQRGGRVKPDPQLCVVPRSTDALK
jgi:hypothetical protein